MGIFTVLNAGTLPQPLALALATLPGLRVSHAVAFRELAGGLRAVGALAGPSIPLYDLNTVLRFHKTSPRSRASAPYAF